jgi:DNA mismatch repair ATPase MutL
MLENSVDAETTTIELVCKMQENANQVIDNGKNV